MRVGDACCVLGDVEMRLFEPIGVGPGHNISPKPPRSVTVDFHVAAARRKLSALLVRIG